MIMFLYTNSGVINLLFVLGRVKYLICKSMIFKNTLFFLIQMSCFEYVQDRNKCKIRFWNLLV